MNVRCIICGLRIAREGEPNDSWLQRYRMIYRTSDGVYLSDTLVRRRSGDGSSFQVPLQNSIFANIPIIQETNGQFGFVMHNACWDIFKVRAGSTSISLHRMVEVFESVPRAQGSARSSCYAWGHMYKGLICLAPGRWPWEQREWCTPPRTPIETQTINRSPFASPIEDILKTTSSQSQAFDMNPVKYRSSPDKDCFAGLPLEIVEEIASYLSTTTVLTARLASPAFTQLFYDQMFWSSRFRPNHERGFLFEVWGKRVARDWRWLYRQTRDIAATYPGLNNRLRIWCIAELILEKLTITRGDPSTHLSTGQRLSRYRKGEVYGGPTVAKTLKTKTAAQAIVPEKTAVPPDVYRIGISVIEDGETTYVAGIHLFHGMSGNVIRLGYVTAPGTTSYSDINSLKGFVVSVGSTGLHALQIVHRDDDSLSTWHGNPKLGAKTRRLVFVEEIVALSAGFDGYKMVYMAAWGTRAPKSKGSKQIDLIRNHFLWYPELPTPKELINETSVFGKLESSSKGFRPVIFANFGGSSGSGLRHLVCVSAMFGLDRLLNVTFYFEADGVLCRPVHLSQRQANALGMAEFEIHGFAGEYIERVEVETSTVSDYITGIRLTTNWEDQWTASGNLLGITKYTVLQTAPGTIPTGLYSTEGRGGIKNMGIISQRVKPWGRHHI
ncbi:hypothetical protein ASPCAL01836 [Aspergillus calidoustus]|uniref:F-box domain-containing protein n=1 Tax=Aspergillus calidoustus TaxID=454130 RepID=A0A0U5GIU0_ASPCI|nr:hypothetical protein ASPCAL01836 [Aspergillus calidoustus]